MRSGTNGLAEREYNKYFEELTIISDLVFIQKMGWTFTQLEEERKNNPYDVMIAKDWLEREEKYKRKETEKRNKELKKSNRKRRK